VSETRYAVGIDLGTTHCALSWVDLARSERDDIAQDLMPIPQLTAAGSVQDLPLLPSFLYLPHPDEFAATDLTLPWSDGADMILGEMARAVGARTPIRLVSSAKSWLCHPGVDRRAAILPPGAPDDEVPRLSPFDASVRYLSHLRDAWNQAHPEHDLAEQEVTVTVPASFDPAARELTAEAAQSVGFQHLVLLEEPQAAIYSWIHESNGEWRKQAKVGDMIPVIDLGGGTTDLSLIAVTERDGNLELTRVAVGEHILLGGDNMDLALAHVVNGKLKAEGKSLEQWQIQALTHGCRQAKETILADASVDSVPVVVPSRGSKLIGGSIRTELTRDEVSRTLVEGFFPQVGSDARPAGRARAALTKLGLPYAQDAAVTRHLAAFLGMQTGATDDLEGFTPKTTGSFLHPTAVLFNGGVFKAGILAERVMDVLNGWLEADGAPPARLLEGGDLDLSVARGASYHGYVRQGGGMRIRGGTARSYLRGRGERHARGARHGAPHPGAVPGPLRHGRGYRGGHPAPGVRPGGGRARALPFLRVPGTPGRPGRHAAGGLVRGGARGAGGDPGHAACAAAHTRRRGARAPARHGHRGGHPAPGGHAHRGDGALESGAQCARK
jgi:hypothetical protein